MNPALSDLADRLKSAGEITAADVLLLRAQVYGSDAIAPDDMEVLAALETAPNPGGSGEHCPEWGEFLAEAMVDFVVHQEDPQDYVDEAKAAWVMRVFAGELRPESGLESLVRMLENAVQVPDSFASFTVQKVKAAMLAKGRLEAADVALLRRLVYAGGGEGNLAVTREEAEALFAINTAISNTDAAWPDFFAEAVGACLLAVSLYTPEGRDAALNDEAWLNHKDTLGEFAAGMAHKPDIKGALHEIFHPDDDAWNEWKDADAKFDTASAEAGEITDEEARWLVGQLGQGQLSEPERRLIAFLKRQATSISDLLKPLVSAVPAAPLFSTPFESSAGDTVAPDSADELPPRLVAPATPQDLEPALVFGHRKTPVA